MLRAPAPDFEDAVMARVSAAAWRASQPVPRRRRHILLISVLFVVAAAAAMLVVSLVSAPSRIVLQNSNVDVVAPSASAAANPQAHALHESLARDATPIQPVTVTLVLNQETDDPAGRDYGQQVYDRAREELHALAGVIFVDAGTAGAPQPAFRMTYTNKSKTGGDFHLDPDGTLVATPAAIGQEPLLKLELKFEVDALQSDANGVDTYHAVFWGGGYPMPMQISCIGRREGDCHSTPSDAAALHILSWRLESTAPDQLLDDRLHAMLLDPSAPELRSMAFNSLVKYKKLRMDGNELRTVGDLIAGVGDRALRTQLVRASLGAGNGPDLMRQVQDLLFREKPNGDRVAGVESRMNLVALLAGDLRDEPAARTTLAMIEANDPAFEVRAEARQVLGAQRPSTTR
ncbi:MAG: hypothetical protein WDO12_06545 [Pseudomonadota bacterium]